MEGDVLILHSSVWRLLMMAKGRNNNFSISDIINSFMDALGPSGTLLLPTFNFKVLNTLKFNIRTTPSETGVMTEVFRQRSGSVRTSHPVLSFAVAGKESRRFAALEDYTGIGADSPFALVNQLGGKIGVLDLKDNSCMSMYHHVELSLGVNYRVIIEREIEYIGWEGNRSSRVVGHYGRDINSGIITNVALAGEELWNLGLYSGERPGKGFGFRTINAIDFFSATAKIINEGRALGMLYDK